MEHFKHKLLPVSFPSSSSVSRNVLVAKIELHYIFDVMGLDSEDYFRNFLFPRWKDLPGLPYNQSAALQMYEMCSGFTSSRMNKTSARQILTQPVVEKLEEWISNMTASNMTGHHLNFFLGELVENMLFKIDDSVYSVFYFIQYCFMNYPTGVSWFINDSQ
eukprot:TRINITY_DN2399_c0_g1_i9.p1 TRINITY_DN2399_c0_g1~~TRINITY_DN2399_c0_g1_i9.p1  ORF type:complete len:161 (-),score=33.07 TRINITY_DN2399_c0_g1_i9:79-561(-)